MKPSLDIVIVNWNTGSQLFDCLKSIVVDASVTLERVVVVDNGSDDGSLEGIDALDIPITLIRNLSNRGFAAACNQGAYGSIATYLLFLNPDTILNRDSLSRPVAFLEDPLHETIGIVGIQLVNETGIPNRWCCRFPTPGMFFREMTGLTHIKPAAFPGYVMVEWNHDDSRNVDHVLGAFYLIRRRVFDDLQGFDERYFVYKEDLDLSLRARRSGWRCHYLADVSAYHKGGGSSEQIKSTRLFYALRSRTQYSYKHFAWASATGLLFVALLIEPIARLGWGLKRRAGRHMLETIAGTWQLLIWIGLTPFRGKRR